MERGEMEKLVDEYMEQVKIGKEYRNAINAQIEELELLREKSFDKDLYKIVYKKEYGDYFEVREEMGEEIRRRYRDGEYKY